MIWGKNEGKVPGPLELRSDLNPDAIKYFARNGALWMPQFRKTEITDEELEALAAYLGRNAEK
ncbi:MAG: hypothetical protein A3F84_13125 [Candidatus Handelsmanbacteria bacterium RIFCSPLOWO2_12_FULL_64_10]|uniref:Cytochrome c domain-containing protein n=1 Tax=Handelsmanbacteria sp. (strain RIFCSPLOWO2_12_FULL_64_10) TaxID=1817868 RepID=A0A1F6D016_HANXR|nr:MAG: hypothetical protein A3F84_13125 [Candidatus Handelsmanbacteria bacterium RIFCSPLOWO2_12_FULL_64_10]